MNFTEGVDIGSMCKSDTKTGGDSNVFTKCENSRSRERGSEELEASSLDFSSKSVYKYLPIGSERSDYNSTTTAEVSASHENVYREMYYCKFCQKSFQSKYTCRRHERLHTGKDLHCCPVCKRGFTQNCHLVEHYRIHTGEKPYRCAECPVRFRKASNLRIHIRHSHFK